MHATKISLGDFGNDCPDGECVLGFYTSVGIPAGQEILLNHPDFTTPFDDDLFGLQGTIDDDGTWHWDGKGNPTDDNLNTVLRIDAWYDTAERADEIMAG
jgi:hypothetical protein